MAFFVNKKIFRLLPLIWMVIFSGFAFFLARAFPMIRVESQLLAWVLLGFGLGLFLWSAFYFKKLKTTIHPLKEPQALIVAGPFKINRNPIYTAMALIIGSMSFFGGGVSGLVFCAVFCVVITKLFILEEEEKLRKNFGKEAEIYFKKTRRW